MNCRHCGTHLEHVFVDLGFAPPSNAYLTAANLKVPEVFFPLKVYICDNCWLAQTEDYSAADDLFRFDYAYFSSTSKGWLDHARCYVETITDRLGLDSDSFVIEVASNDGYLLKNFVAAQVPCLGIEPTTSTAAAAEALGVPVLREFFGADLGARLAAEGKQADLILGNNVYAHVPDINDFTAGLKAALRPGGTITLEFPHLLRLIEHTLFDTIYHEHYSYLALCPVRQIFAKAGLRVCDVEELSTHGGSLRVYGCHADDPRSDSPAVAELVAAEQAAGLQRLETYRAFQLRTELIKDDLLLFLIEQKRAGRKVAGYGAAAKGNTLLNFAGIRPDLLSFVGDAAEAKQGKYLPGSHIPVVSPHALRDARPDVVLILPWNIAPEITSQERQLADAGAQFVIAVPEIRFIR